MSAASMPKLKFVFKMTVDTSMIPRDRNFIICTVTKYEE